MTDILNEIDTEYVEFIRKKVLALKVQKKLLEDETSLRANDIINMITDEKEFLARFTSMSNEAKKFYLSMHTDGRIIDLKEFPQREKGIPLKNEINECIDKLMIFGLPSRNDPEVLIIPLEYSTIPNFSPDDVIYIRLLSLLKEYPKNTLNRIAEFYTISTRLPRSTMLVEIYKSILSNLNETLDKLSDEEQKIMEYIVKNDGIIGFYDVMEHFSIGKKKAYHDNIYPKDILSYSSYTNGEHFVSLLLKGIISYHAEERYYYVDLVYIPDEIIMTIIRRRTQSISKIKSNKNTGNKVSPNDLKNYGFDLAVQMKRFFTLIYYLEKRSKKRTLEALKNTLKMEEKDFNFTLDLAISEGWIKQTASSVSITPEGFQYLEEKNFSSRLHKHIFENHMFSYWLGKEGSKNLMLNQLRNMLIQAIYDLKEPRELGEIALEIKSGESYFILARKLRSTLVRSNEYGGSGNASEYFKRSMEDEVWEWFAELTDFLRVYDLIKMSKIGIYGETYIFPEPQFREIFEKQGKVDTASVEKQEKKPLKVLPNNEVLIEITADFSDLKTMADFADLVSVDRVCTFSITKSSLSGFLNRSGDLNNILSFLKKKSSVGVPNTVEHLITDMERKKDEVNITKCQAVLQVSDRTIIDAIMRTKTISEMVEKRLSPDTLIIKEDVSLYRFVTELRKKGYVVPIEVQKEKTRRRPAWSAWR